MVAESLEPDVGQVLGLPADPQPVNGHGAPAGAAPLQPYDLAAVMRQKLPPPRVFQGLLYPRTVHSIAGPPESAKTIIALWLALKAMLAGQPVAMVDEETGPRQVADLLASMGADPDMVDALFTYLPETELRWTAPDRGRLADVLRDTRPRLLIIDSVSEILASAGIDDNDGMAVTRFMKNAIKPIPRILGPAVLLIDHDAKDAKESRYAKGSGAKLASTTAAFKVATLRPFSREQDGLVKLTVSKDRLGCLHRNWKVRVRTSPLILEFDKATPGDFSGDGQGGQGLSPAAEKLLAVLSAEPRTWRQLVDAIVAEYGHGLKRETVSRNLTWLMEAGMAERMDLGVGREALWAKPGGQLPDPDDPGPPEPVSDWPPGSAGEAANL